MPKTDAVPREFRTEAAAKARNIIIAGFIVFAALSGPIGFAIAMNASGTAAEAAAMVAGEDEPLHQNFAQAAAARWAFGGERLPAITAAEDFGRPTFSSSEAEELGLEPDSVAGIRDIGVRQLIWEGFQLVDMGRDVFAELHNFLVVSDSGLFLLTVPVTEVVDSITGDELPVLGGSPSLQPYVRVPNMESAPQVDWHDNRNRRSTPGPVADRVAEWASAFAADDGSALYDITGDQREVVYRGIGGFRVIELDVGQSADYPGLNDAFMTRVTVTMANSRGVMFRADYDVLVDAVDTPRPFITSWGAAGAGPFLEPGEHARPEGSRQSGGFASVGTFSDVPTDEPGENGDEPSDGDGRPLPNSDRLLVELQSNSPDQMRRALDPETFNVGDIALLIEAVDEAEPAVIRSSTAAPDIRERTAVVDINLTVGGETSDAQLNLVWDEPTSSWRIRSIQPASRQNFDHPYITLGR